MYVLRKDENDLVKRCMAYGGRYTDRPQITRNEIVEKDRDVLLKEDAVLFNKCRRLVLDHHQI